MNEHETEFQDLIEQLGKERPLAPEPNRAFTTELRGRLLGQYEQKDGWGGDASLGRLASTATALAVLALVVFVGWFLSSSQQQPTIAGEAIQTTREVETAVDTTTNNVIHTTLHISKYVDETYTWKATVEHWQTADGRLNRTLVADENGQLDHFAQSDGARLYIGNTINPIYSPNRRLRSYFQLNETQPDGIKAGEPPFYSDLGWDGLAETLVQSEWDCADESCVIEHLYQPPLGISANRHAAGEFSWGGSLVSTEEVNGRLIDNLIINYSLQDGVNLPQYRLVKIDQATYRPLAIFDYDGDKLLKSIEVISQEQINIPLTEFQMVPEVVAETVMNGYLGTVDLGDIQLSGYGWDAWPTSESPHVLTFHFFWQAAELPEEGLTSFVHILDEDSGLVFQRDTALQWETPTHQGEQFTAHFSLEEQLSNGRYQIQVGVYDAATGQRLATSEGETAVQVDEFVIEGVPTALAEVARLHPIELTSIYQANRSSTGEGIQVEAVISYDLTGVPEGDYVMKLHYAAPDWEENMDGRSPIDSMSDYLPLTETQGSLTITFSGNPQEMQSIADTDKPVLVLMLGQFNQPNGGQRLDTLSTITYSSYPLDLATTEAITYTIP